MVGLFGGGIGYVYYVGGGVFVGDFCLVDV